MITNNICKVAEFKDSVFYKAICSCGGDHHDQTLIIEANNEYNQVSLQIYSKVITSQFTSSDSQYEYYEAMKEGDYVKMAFYKAKLLAEHIIARIRFTRDIWFRGFVEVENEFTFRNNAAIDDYVKAIQIAKNKIKENQNGTNSKSS